MEESMSRSLIALAFSAALSLAAGAAHAVPAVVLGNMDPWLAGMPAGSTASLGDVAPAQSPLLVSGLALGAGSYLTFTGVTGGASNTPSCCIAIEGGGFTGHTTGAENGISNAVAPLSTLVGVFLDDSQPSLSAAPATLDFSSIGLDLSDLSPLLKQVFFIGNGLTSGLTAQKFWVP